MLNSFLSLWGSRDCQPLKYRLSEGLFVQSVCAPILGLALAVCSVVSLSVSLSRGGCGGPQADPRSRGPPAHPSQGLCWHLKPLLRFKAAHALVHCHLDSLRLRWATGPTGVCVCAAAGRTSQGEGARGGLGSGGSCVFLPSKFTAMPGA